MDDTKVKVTHIELDYTETGEPPSTEEDSSVGLGAYLHKPRKNWLKRAWGKLKKMMGL